MQNLSAPSAAFGFSHAVYECSHAVSECFHAAGLCFSECQLVVVIYLVTALIIILMVI